MKKKILITAGMLLGVVNSYSTGFVGESREIEGKRYVVPYSRESDAFPKMSTKGKQYRSNFLNERDNSNEIIVYSDLDDAPAKHCRSKKGHSILREDSITGEMVRLCRLDTPGARVEGSKMEVEEIQYYVANTENKYVWKKLIEDKKIDPSEKVYSDLPYTAYAKYTRPEKEAEIKRRYLEPKDKVQKELRDVFYKKFQEQYGRYGIKFEEANIEKR